MAVDINGLTGVTFNNGSVQGSSGLGFGQTWQNVTGSRAQSTTYTNSTGSPIIVSFRGGDNSGQPLSLTVTVSGNATYISGLGFTAGGIGNWTIVIPPGATYSAAWNASANFSQWWELRP
jgi:hypothetical protein